MTINEMQNNIINTLGHEHPYTIEFFEMCEKGWSIEWLENVMECLIAMAIGQEERDWET